MIRKLLCWFGFHKYSVIYDVQFVFEIWYNTYKRRCIYCDHVQYGGYNEKST